MGFSNGLSSNLYKTHKLLHERRIVHIDAMTQTEFCGKSMLIPVGQPKVGWGVRKTDFDPQLVNAEMKRMRAWM